MPRIERVDVGNTIYHVINRANARVKIFDDTNDYINFEIVLEEAIEKFDMRLLAYCIMPNHWHLVLYPKKDGDLALFMGWLTNTHTRRWHTLKKTVGNGHLYQGRYKSFICQDDFHLLALVRYVERNAKRANLVEQAEDWKWSSSWRRVHGVSSQKRILSAWPISMPSDYLKYLNDESQNGEEINTIRKSIVKNIPFGNDIWCDGIVKKLKLEQTLRGAGRPKIK